MLRLEEESDTKILQGFNLKVHAGETVGIVGSSGSGKSTIISLIERFYDPINGEIFLDGCNLAQLQLKWLRSQIGLVSQEPVLFATSIKENILFGKEGASMDLVMKAAKAANAHTFITSLPNGYETQVSYITHLDQSIHNHFSLNWIDEATITFQVGQFGIKLSGGQKQRIAITRALIRDPRILLLDEATSALDAKSEIAVQEASDQALFGRTMIVVAHRLTTIQNADKIVVLHSGRVIESGSHSDLMQTKDGKAGEYFRMVQTQQLAVKGRSDCTPGSVRIRSSPAFSASHHSWSSSEGNPAYASPEISFSELKSSEMDPYVEENEKTSKKPSYPPPSQWKLLKLSAPEWKKSLLGCLGAASAGTIQPIAGYALGSLISTYVIQDDHKIQSESRIYIFLFLGLAVAQFVTSILQHYNFGIAGERLTKRVREKVLANVFTFEVGWFDKDANTSAAISARIAMEATMVRSLVGDRMSLLINVFTNVVLSFSLSLVISWKVAIVVIALQPLITGCMYLRTILMKSALWRKRSSVIRRTEAENSACSSYNKESIHLALG